jgi:hypothetical protein
LKTIKLLLLGSAVFFMMKPLHADVSLVYDVVTATGESKQATIHIGGRWLRLEMEPKGSSDYVVFDTGRLLMFEVDSDEKSFQVTRLRRLYWPENNALLDPRFRPERKKQSIGGVVCQQVREHNQHHPEHPQVAQHCMASGAAMRLNTRELITLSRLFTSFRRIGNDWFGIATPDERLVSVASEYRSGAKLKLESIKVLNFNESIFKVPADFKRLKPDLPAK